MVKEAAELSEIIQNRKEKYFYDRSLKLNNPQDCLKTYWSIIKSSHNGRKIPVILSLTVNGRVVTKFKGKANIFNKYFSAVGYQKIKHILQNQNYHLVILRMKIYTKYKIVKTLDTNKVHGYDKVPLRMLKLFHKSTIKLLSINLKTRFLISGKKQVLFHDRKGEKDLIKNYRPVSFFDFNYRPVSYVAPWCSGYDYCTTSFNKA